MSEVQLYLGDCLEVMKQIPDGSVDAVVTDPPYGMGKDFNGNGSDGEQAALWLQQAFYPQVARVLAGGGMAFVFSGTRLVDRAIELGKAAGLHFCRLLWMYKPNDCTYPWRGWLLTSEAIPVFSKGKPRKWDGGIYGHDCYTFNHTTGELPANVSHPSVKPLAVISDIVAKSTPSATVLDPFMGSGTTGVACVNTGRNFIGIEIDPGYYEIAEKRIADAQAQLKLEVA